MTILSVCQDLSSTIGITKPTVLFSGTSRTLEELQSLANEVALDIAKRHDWQAFMKVATITGDGSTEDWDLPSDFARMPIKTRLWGSAEPNLPYEHIRDYDNWLGLEVQSFNTITKRWIMYGEQVHIVPAIDNAATAKYFYQSNAIVAPASGANKALFSIDTDTFRLNERTLRLGMKWQWKADKGQSYAEDMESFEQALAVDIARDKGPTTIKVGTARARSGAEFAFPQALGS